MGSFPACGTRLKKERLTYWLLGGNPHSQYSQSQFKFVSRRYRSHYQVAVDRSVPRNIKHLRSKVLSGPVLIPTLCYPAHQRTVQWRSFLVRLECELNPNYLFIFPKYNNKMGNSERSKPLLKVAYVSWCESFVPVNPTQGDSSKWPEVQWNKQWFINSQVNCNNTHPHGGSYTLDLSMIDGDLAIWLDRVRSQLIISGCNNNTTTDNIIIHPLTDHQEFGRRSAGGRAYIALLLALISRNNIKHILRTTEESSSPPLC